MSCDGLLRVYDLTHTHGSAMNCSTWLTSVVSKIYSILLSMIIVFKVHILRGRLDTMLSR